MKTQSITQADLEGSVIAVPPLARRADLSIDATANRALVQYLERAGVRSLMYGGNANFYNLGTAEYVEAIDLLADAVSADTWVLPSVGPDFGKMLDQAALLRKRGYPTAMLLPNTLPHTHDGLETGIRRFTDAFGRPAVLYIKSDNYLPAAAVERLYGEGRISSIKYAVVRADPSVDAYLDELIDRIGTARLVSGIGERPAVVHFRKFGLKAMTSGSICVGPRGSTRLLSLMQAGRFEEAEALRAHYLPLEDLRDGISPIRVLHDAVTLAGIADMGPMLPHLSNVTGLEAASVQKAAQELRTWDRTLAEAA